MEVYGQSLGSQESSKEYVMHLKKCTKSQDGAVNFLNLILNII
jgi:hypothetical protein